MLGLMQDRPLLISTLIEHAAQNHADTEIVSRASGGVVFRYTYSQASKRAKQLANALARLGMQQGDRVATLAWNTHRHYEIYFAVSGSGAICHTVNPRLFFEQISFICRHAEDSVMFFDASFVDIVNRLAPLTPSIKHWIALCDRATLPADLTVPNVLTYEELIAPESDSFEWPQFDERTASSLCYTSGTTGDPKGVLYTHRSTILHAYAAAMPDHFSLSVRDVVMPASSMYHANAWGLPYAITAVGCKLVLPGQQLDGKSLHELIAAEKVTLSCGVPTIWLGLTQHIRKTGQDIGTFKRLIIGGAACPLALMTTLREDHGIETVHLWGMTETSPLGTVNTFKPKHDASTPAQRDELRVKQGRIVYGCELKIVDEQGRALPHDGVAFGDLMVRGWWIASGYYKLDKAVLDDQGWFATGDVATIDADGYMRITDRSKDVIKSGGEWISSIDLENAAVGHPAVAEAAVIGVYHPKWDERPVLIVVPRDPAHPPSKQDLIEFLSDKVAKWWLPDDVVVVSEIPHTATGKILKTALREQFGRHLAVA
jgi:acyl-CoA synthetase (AMP-forming)/AMP-acid ligase II